MLMSANFSLGVVKKKHTEWLLCVNNISTKFQLYILFRFWENEGGRIPPPQTWEAPKSPVLIGLRKINFDARMKEVAESLASKSQVRAALETKDETKDKNKEKIKKTSNV